MFAWETGGKKGYNSKHLITYHCEKKSSIVSDKKIR